MSLTGENITLIELEKEHIHLLRKWRNDPAIRKWIFQKWPISSGMQERWYEAYLAGSDYRVLVACHRSSGKPIGYMRLANIDHENKSVEIGGDIGEKECRGKGYGKEMYELALEFLFNELNFNRVYLQVIKDNEVAIEFYKKLGFVNEGDLRESVHKSGRYLNVVVMSMLKEEYAEIAGGGR